MASYEQLTYLLITRDPVHVGAGGYRLGRVDNSIVREPGTGIPKIPGSSMHGAIRSYAARQYENLNAAGQSHAAVDNPQEDPVCYTFGYLTTPQASGEDQRDAPGFAGVANIFDAQVLLFPVRSSSGPLWVTTRRLLENAQIPVNDIPDDWPADMMLPSADLGQRANLGWLNLRAGDPVTITWPTEWQQPEWQTVAPRIAVVQEGLLSHVINSNLEVRTSVSIDPHTGAAKKGALFTYEALPRATFLTMDIVIDDYRGSFPAVDETCAGGQLPGNEAWTEPREVVEAGLDLINWLGVGGMGTRGFGRIGRVGKGRTANLQTVV